MFEEAATSQVKLEAMVKGLEAALQQVVSLLESVLALVLTLLGIS